MLSRRSFDPPLTKEELDSKTFVSSLLSWKKGDIYVSSCKS
jgi:hypothetical protein